MNICKAHRAYFSLGSIGTFQGFLNPLSGCSISSIFVIPILLYGSDTWILIQPLLQKLEKFQIEIGKCILRLPKYHSDVSVFLGLHWPRLRVHILMGKLVLLSKLLHSDGVQLSSQVFHTLAAQLWMCTRSAWLSNVNFLNPNSVPHSLLNVEMTLITPAL